VYDITDQYLLGSSLMVCPVTQKGAATRVVYLPAGTWIDYWTGKAYTGRQYLNVLTPLDKIPLFVKAGSIIPTQPVLQYVGERTIDTLTLNIYPGDSATCRLYTDDGKSLAYRQGQFAVTRIRQQTLQHAMEITIQPAAGNYRSPLKYFSLKVHLPAKPQSVSGSSKWNYDAAAGILQVGQVPADNENRITIRY
jgi:alpha-glucosidase (family GH31 glycosyl hydrolase)